MYQKFYWLTTTCQILALRCLLIEYWLRHTQSLLQGAHILEGERETIKLHKINDKVPGADNCCGGNTAWLGGRPLKAMVRLEGGGGGHIVIR